MQRHLLARFNNGADDPYDGSSLRGDIIRFESNSATVIACNVPLSIKEGRVGRCDRHSRARTISNTDGYQNPRLSGYRGRKQR